MVKVGQAIKCKCLSKARRLLGIIRGRAYSGAPTLASPEICKQCHLHNQNGEGQGEPCLRLNEPCLRTRWCCLDRVQTLAELTQPAILEDLSSFHRRQSLVAQRDWDFHLRRSAGKKHQSVLTLP